MTHEVWAETGVKYALNNKISLSVDLTQRYGTYGLATVFPQMSIRYKVTKWFRPSIDYRWISSRDFDQPFESAHRLNGNLQFDYVKKRMSLGFRVRYQYNFQSLVAQYDTEFDRAWRIKPSLSYDFNNLPVTPNASLELFYSANNGPTGKQFTRVRYYFGAELDTKGPHAFDLGIFMDQWLNAIPKKRIMYSIGYCYSIGSPEKEKKKSKNLRDL